MLRQGAAVVEAIGGAQAVGGPTAPLTAELLDAAADQLAKEYDEVNGGFGGAPKFPPHMNLLFLLRHHQRTGSARSLEIVRHTCEAMARGGIHDQLAGGFARYAVDGHWTVPHFEKMLYDNALLLRVYTQLWRLTGDALALRVARDTARFLADELHRPEQGFASALDADTEGVEGLTYVWTPAELVQVLGEEDGRWAADLFAVTDTGSFEHGTSVLRLARDVDDADPAVRERWQGVVRRLLAVRDSRPQPARDDKVVAAWNGLAVTALAEFVRLVETSGRIGTEGEANLLEGVTIVADGAMRHTAEYLARVHMVDGRLRRASGTAGSAIRPAYLRTTAAWPRPSAPCTRSPVRVAGWNWPVSCSTSRWHISPRRVGRSTTRPTTRSSLSPGPPTRRTMPPLPAGPRSSRRLSRTRR
ncbi:hypothetical protein GCM10029963_37150 [Micromonospora andamanensis]